MPEADEIFATYHDRIFRYVLGFVNETAEAEDNGVGKNGSTNVAFSARAIHGFRTLFGAPAPDASLVAIRCVLLFSDSIDLTLDNEIVEGG